MSIFTPFRIWQSCLIDADDGCFGQDNSPPSDDTPPFALLSFSSLRTTLLGGTDSTSGDTAKPIGVYTVLRLSGATSPDHVQLLY
jgi:hypothetical protein